MCIESVLFTPSTPIIYMNATVSHQVYALKCGTGLAAPPLGVAISRMTYFCLQVISDKLLQIREYIRASGYSWPQVQQVQQVNRLTGTTGNGYTYDAVSFAVSAVCVC